MPRKKSSVHRHFKTADNQDDRKIEVVECIHCGYKTAGNNAARLLRHLQLGCWPASSPDDPVLLFSDRDASQTSTPLVDRLNINANIATPTHLSGLSPSPSPNTGSSAWLRKAALSDSLESRSYLIRVIVKDTKDPEVSRLLSVPKSFSFRHLQRALSVALGYKADNGMFEITYPNWTPTRGRPPRRKQIYVFHNEEQKNNWHELDDQQNMPDISSSARYLDNVVLEDLLAELKSMNIAFFVGPWGHSVEIIGESAMSSSTLTSNRHATCLAGEGHAVLESADSLMWQAFKDAYAANPPTATQKSYRAFYEKDCRTGDPRGLAGSMPWKWDINYVNRELGLLPAAPNAPQIGEKRAMRENELVRNISEAQTTQSSEDDEPDIMQGHAYSQHSRSMPDDYGRVSSQAAVQQSPLLT